VIISGIMESFVGLVLAAAMVFGLYSGAIRPLLEYDFESFYIDQTKSAIYSSGFSPSALSDPSYLGTHLSDSQVFELSMFKTEHLLMLPAVDLETDIGNRSVPVTQRFEYRKGQRAANYPIYTITYPVNDSTMYNPAITLDDVNIAPLLPYPTASSTLHFNAVIDGTEAMPGRRKTSTLLFYTESLLPREANLRP
jgi:hypothetical protein